MSSEDLDDDTRTEKDILSSINFRLAVLEQQLRHMTNLCYVLSLFVFVPLVLCAFFLLVIVCKP